MELQAALQASLASSSSHEPTSEGVATPTRAISAQPAAPGSGPSQQDWFGSFGALGGLVPGLAGFGSGIAPRERTVGVIPNVNIPGEEEEDEEARLEEYRRARAQAEQSRNAYLRAREGMTGPHGIATMDEDEDEGIEDPATASDPVAASMARTQRMLTRMQRQQEAAFSIGGGGPSERERRRQQEEEEALQRAIEESRAMYESSGGEAGQDPAAATRPPMTEQEAWDAAERAAATTRQQPPAWHEHRVYDDDDEELQAALRASLESAPGGTTIPEDPPTPAPALVPVPPASSTNEATTQPPALQRHGSATSDAYETESEADTEEGDAHAAEPVESVEEMRKKRLARFGG
jgi:hypothetical protein